MIRHFFLLLAFSFVIDSTPADTTIPDLGNPAGSVLSPQQEAEIGKKLMRLLRKHRMIIEDPLITRYIQLLGYKLVAQSDQPQRKFTFFVLKDNSINAFAAPGAYIGINAGLIETAKSESELAAVVAHEVAHITQNHMSRMYASKKRRGIAVAAAMIAALIASRGNSQLTKGVIATGIAGSYQAQVNFTRANEKEADHIGIRILAHAGFDPNAMAKFFQRMQKAGSLYGNRLPEFLSTHPVSATRIADAQNRVGQFEVRRTSENFNFYLMRARIKTLITRNPARTLNRFRKALASGFTLNKDATRYGLALALLRTGNPAAARRHIDILLRKDPTRLAYIVTSGEIALARRNTAKVKEVFEDALVLYPNNYAVVYYYAQALTRLQQYKRAYRLISNYLSNTENRVEAPLHQLYSLSAAKTGHPGEAFLHRGEYYYLNDQLKLAITNLTRAASFKSNNEFLAAKIDARLREFKREAHLRKPRHH